MIREFVSLYSHLFAHTHMNSFFVFAPVNIPVIGFNAVLMSEHFASFFVFGILHVALAVKYIKSTLSTKAYDAAKKAVFTGGALVASALVLIVVSYVAASPTFGWT